MTVNTADRPAADLREPGGLRRAKSQFATSAMWLAFVVMLVPLGFVLVTVIAKGASVISWQFLTSSIPPNVLPANFGGMGPAVLGTLEITASRRSSRSRSVSSARSTSTSTAATARWRGCISFLSDVMTGVPSIVMGLFIYTIWVIPRGLTGYSGMAGAFALACLMLPIVIRSSYEMLRLVPDSLRQGSYALGATKARVTLTVVLPAAVGRHRQRRPARRRPRGGRDGPAAVHHRDGDGPSTRTSSPVPTPRCPRRSGPTHSSPTPVLKRGAGVRRSR